MYLITGASGNVGSEVVSQLLAEGKKVRVFTRDAAKVAQWGDQVEVATGDLTSPETFAKAVSGVDGVFIMGHLWTAVFFVSSSRPRKRRAIRELYFSPRSSRAFPILPSANCIRIRRT